MDGAGACILLASAVAMLASCHKVCFIGSEYDPQAGIPLRWFLPYKVPCECTAVRLGGTHIPASSYRQGAPHYLKELFLTETAECSSPEALGMEDGTIPDDHITASSVWESTNYPGCCPPQKGRLNSDSIWAPSSNPDSWIEMDLATSTVVSGVITQSLALGKFNGYVTMYKVAFKKQSTSQCEHVRDGNGNVKLFKGNTDARCTPVTNMFNESVVASVVRIEPTEWHVWVRLQLELLGCRRN
ncbi:lactadherin-like [Patiria miniata]|uniref:F5/8 type C domain-containing protein n=1 Tax=Patiria miniata TaxID=46514 RepID=A0A914ADY1_PATMI|nr:lactadherin-like [Patiria miniata]